MTPEDAKKSGYCDLCSKRFEDCQKSGRCQSDEGSGLDRYRDNSYLDEDEDWWNR